ncbi:group II intron maturase-specific domain-containing protein [Mesorhizobium sp. BHbsci]
MRAQLNRVLLGWSTYFCHGTRAPAYEAVDRHFHDRISNFLRKRHKLQGRGTSQASRENISEKLGVLRLRRGQGAPPRGPYNEASRKAGCGSSARPV